MRSARFMSLFAVLTAVGLTCSFDSAEGRDVPWARPPEGFDVEHLFPLLPPPNVETECRMIKESSFAMKHPDDGREKHVHESGRNNPENFRNETYRIDKSDWDYRVKFRVENYKPFIRTYSKTYGGPTTIIDFNSDPNIGNFWINDYVEFSNTIGVIRIFNEGIEIFTFQLDKDGTGDLMNYFSQQNMERPVSSFRHLKCWKNWSFKTKWDVE